MPPRRRHTPSNASPACTRAPAASADCGTRWTWSTPVRSRPRRRGWVVRRVDLGWPERMVGVEYDGEQHWTGPDAYANDIDRLEFLAARGWCIVRVSARQL